MDNPLRSHSLARRARRGIVRIFLARVIRFPGNHSHSTLRGRGQNQDAARGDRNRDEMSCKRARPSFRAPIPSGTRWAVGGSLRPDGRRPGRIRSVAISGGNLGTGQSPHQLGLAGRSAIGQCEKAGVTMSSSAIGIKVRDRPRPCTNVVRPGLFRPSQGLRMCPEKVLGCIEVQATENRDLRCCQGAGLRTP
jgi:hypothetical protein